MKSCFIIGSKCIVIMMMTILLLWQIVSKPLLQYWFLLLYLQFVESLYWCVQYYLYYIQEEVFWNMTGSYLSNGNLSKQFSALIVFCDIICSYLCSFYDEVYDFWHMTWKMTKCSLCFMCCNVTSLSWQMFDVPRLICLFNCLKFILAYLSHLE